MKSCKVIIPKLYRSFSVLKSQVNATSALKPFSEIPGPKTYPLIGNVFGIKAPEVGHGVMRR